MEEIFKTEKDVIRENQRSRWIALRKKYKEKYSAEERRKHMRRWVKESKARRTDEYKLQARIKYRVKRFPSDPRNCRWCNTPLDLLSKSNFFCNDRHRALHRKKYQKEWSKKKNQEKKAERQRRKNARLSEVFDVQCPELPTLQQQNNVN